MLGGTALAAGLLVWAALAPLGDPAGLGRSEHQSRLVTLEGAVAAEWERLAGGGGFLSADPEAFAFEPPLPARDDPSAESSPIAPITPSAGFSALVLEAARAGGSARAESLLATAFETAGAESEQALASLLHVQWRARHADPAAAAELWRERRGALDAPAPGLAASPALLAALAAAPGLTAQERASLQGDLANHWDRSRLALPPLTLSAEEGGLRRALRRELAQLAEDETARETLERAEARERGRLLAARLGAELPAPGSPLVLARVADGSASYWLDPRAQPRPLAAPADPAAVADLLESAVRARAALPAEVRLDLVAGDPSPANQGAALQPLGRPIPLAGTDLVVSLMHPDPPALERAAAAPFGAARWALLVAAATVAVAGLLTFRSLGRGRRLAALRAQFVTSVSHELRTPLASLLLLAENLSRGDLGPEATARHHRGLLEETRRLRRLVEDVLDVARLERGDGPQVEPEPVAAAQLAARLASQARTRLAAAGIELEVRGAEALPETLELDALAVERALFNLVDNAARHSGAKRVRLEWRAGGSGGWTLSLADDGRGLSPSERERVILPFERGRAGAAGGVGLGLAIADAVARAHGGRLEVAAADLGGAEFRLHLPHAAA